MSLRDKIRRVLGSKSGSKITKKRGTRIARGDISFDVQQKGDAHYLIVNVGKLKYRIPMAGNKKTPKKFYKDYLGL